MLSIRFSYFWIVNMTIFPMPAFNDTHGGSVAQCARSLGFGVATTRTGYTIYHFLTIIKDIGNTLAILNFELQL